MANILIVDDELGIRELLFEILNEEGHNVILVENAEQARWQYAHQLLDVILLDIWMPDISGLFLLKEWADKGLLTTPVIMMSGYAAMDMAAQATKMGALCFLEKPIATQKLMQAINYALVYGQHQMLMSSASPTASVSRKDFSICAKSQELNFATATRNTGSSSKIARSEVTTFAKQATPRYEDNLRILLDVPLRTARDAFERAYFEYHLSQAKGSMTRVAKNTGLERTHLYRKFKHLGIECGRSRGTAAPVMSMAFSK